MQVDLDVISQHGAHHPLQIAQQSVEVNLLAMFTVFVAVHHQPFHQAAGPLFGFEDGRSGILQPGFRKGILQDLAETADHGQ